MSEQRVEARNVSMYPEQWAIVDAKAREVGYVLGDDRPNTSAGLRALIAEYERLKANGQTGGNATGPAAVTNSRSVLHNATSGTASQEAEK